LRLCGNCHVRQRSAAAYRDRGPKRLRQEHSHPPPAWNPSRTLIDPDKIAKQLNPFDPARAAISAAREGITRSKRFLANKIGFSVETTLAGNGTLSLIQEAKQSGYRTTLVFIALDDPAFDVKRVRLRVSQGGHDVPDADILRRYQRSLANVPAAIRLVDSATMLDNSGPMYIRVLRTRAGRIICKGASPPAWVEQIVSQLT